jgi:hypothetical protein
MNRKLSRARDPNPAPCFFNGGVLNIIVCPPGPEPKAEPITYLRQRPVDAAHRGEDGEQHSATGLSFADTSRMQTRTRKGYSKILPIPAYALSDGKLREVVVRAVEMRAGVPDKLAKGSQAQRMEFAHKRLLAQVPFIERRLENLCHRFVERAQRGSMTREERCKWERQQQELDTRLMMVARLPAVIAGVLYMSYRLGYDSVGVAEELGCVRPCGVRQILRRCKLLAEKIERGEPRKKIGHPRGKKNAQQEKESEQ